MEFTLSLEEILKEPGVYVGEHFAKGIAVKVTDYQDAWLTCYDSPDDFIPSTEPLHVYLGLFTQKYSKVFNRGELFRYKEK